MEKMEYFLKEFFWSKVEFMISENNRVTGDEKKLQSLVNNAESNLLILEDEDIKWDTSESQAQQPKCGIQNIFPIIFRIF